MKNLVLAITLSRIFLGPIIFLLAVFIQAYFLALLLFFLAALTDYLDGKLARTYKVTSRLGAILDPIADKLLLVFALLSILLITNDPFIGFMVAIILAREIWIAGLREYAVEQNNADATMVTFLAKSKTSAQFVAITMYYLGLANDQAIIIFLASFVLFLALLLGLQTATRYTKNVFNKE